MPNLNLILELLTLALLGLGGYLLSLFKIGVQAGVKTSAEEGVKRAFRDLDWPKELARELQKTRGLERQELRFKSYGTLCRELRPLAIYDTTRIDNKAAAGLSLRLTDWYFTEFGRLLLTPQARDFYFALQNLLWITSSMPSEWNADRSEVLEGDAELTLRAVLNARFPTEQAVEHGTKEVAGVKASDAISVLDYFKKSSLEVWPHQAIGLGSKWKDTIKQLGAVWSELTERERFVILQQVGSKLRSCLVNDLESRER